jgi:hypothetical protein
MGLAEQMFSGMDTAEGFGAGQYFEEGRFDLVVKSIKCVTSRRPENAGKHFFTAEFEVVHHDPAGAGPAVPAGASRTYQVKIEGNTYAFADIKNFVFALCLGTDPKSAPTPKQDPELHKDATAIAMALVDEEYAARIQVERPEIAAIVAEVPGMPVKLEAFKKATRPKPGQSTGGTFTIHQWSPSATESVAA